MSYETQKHKLRHLRNKIQEQDNEVSSQESINKRVKENIDDTKVKTLAFKKFHDFSTDFEYFDTIDSEGNILWAYKTWRIPIGYVQESLLPFLRVEFLMKSSGEGELTQRPFGGTSSYSFSVKDTEYDGILDVTLVAGIYFVVTGTGVEFLPSGIQGKIVVQFLDPRDYY